MIFPCPSPPNRCANPPISNLSAEAPDGPVFLALNTGSGLLPPLGSTWTDPTGFAICQSLTSQQDADLCAQNNQFINQVDDCAGGGGCWRGPTGNPLPIFTNQEASFTAFCPDGSPFVFVVPAGRYQALSVIEANRIAASFAKVEANLNKVCLGTLASFVCLRGFYGSTITVSGRGPFTFSVFSGPLPPGLGLSVTGPNTVLLSGTATAAGNYTFMLMAENSLGYFMRKEYTISVLGITTASLPNFTQGQPYSQQLTAAGGTAPYTFTLEAGSLPAGLTLSGSGLISGTPTDTTSVSFDVGVLDDSGVNVVCESGFVMEANPSGTTTAFAYYKLNESNATRADSIGANPLLQVAGYNNNSSVVLSAAGRINQAADFANPGPALVGYLQPNDANAFTFPASFTISFWIFAPGAVAGAPLSAYSPDMANEGQWRFFADSGINQIGFSTYNPPHSENAILINTAPFTGIWTHVVGLFDKPNHIMRLYMNAVQIGTKAVAGNLNPVAIPMVVGNFYPANSTSGAVQNWPGRVDELAIWKRVLTPAEIIQIYNGGAGLPFDPNNYP